MTQRQRPIDITRRDVLRLGGTTGALLLGGAAVLGTPTFAGTAAAHPKPGNHDVHWGDDIDYLDGEVRTYATTNPRGNLSSLGVSLDADALAAFDEDPLEVPLAFPDGVDLGAFTFFGFDYAPEGHAPEDVYTVPHFDLHFYLVDEPSVEAIPGGPATYDLPADQLPEGYQRIPFVDTDGDGEPDAPALEPGMGEHLVDPSSPEFQPDGSFTHTMIYGAYDPDGDGTGRLTFLEPMVTVEFLEGLEEPVAVDVGRPEAYPVAGEYPTRYVVTPALHGGVYVAVDGFTEFPASSG